MSHFESSGMDEIGWKTDEVAELVVIFPTNVWEYDVLDVFPFSTPEAKAMAAEAKRASHRK